jgi:hypothetical protein
VQDRCVPQYLARQPKSANGSPTSHIFERRPDDVTVFANGTMSTAGAFGSLKMVMIPCCLNIGRWPGISRWENG